MILYPNVYKARLFIIYITATTYFLYFTYNNSNLYTYTHLQCIDLHNNSTTDNSKKNIYGNK